jgi:hypothetical protein
MDTLTEREREIVQAWFDAWVVHGEMRLAGDIRYADVEALADRLGIDRRLMDHRLAEIERLHRKRMG